ncbi:MAG: hypothetical protein AAFX00_07360, partial [Pseudomonadota bacterium]
MANYKYFDGNLGAHRFRDFRNFDLQSTPILADGAVLTWNQPLGDYDETADVFRIDLVFSGDTTIADVTSGPDVGGTTIQDGGKVFTAGTITGVIFRNDSLEKVMEVSGLNISLVWFGAYLRNQLDNGDPLWELGDQIFGAGTNTYIPSDDPNGDGFLNGNDFEEYIGTFGNDNVKNVGARAIFIQDRGGKDKVTGTKEGFEILDYSRVMFDAQLLENGIRVNLSAKKNKDYVIGADGIKDSVRNVDEIRGTHLDDSFVGDNAENVFVGYAGDDLFNGKGGNDLVKYDRADSRGGVDNVEVDMSRGLVRDPFGNIDTLIGIERVRGTDQADIFYSD